jgi:hypothetical protein
MNAKKLFLAINTVDFQSKSHLFVEKNVNLFKKIKRNIHTNLDTSMEIKQFIIFHPGGIQGT